MEAERNKPRQGDRTLTAKYAKYAKTSVSIVNPDTRPAGIGLWVLRQKSSAVEKPDPVSGDNR